MTQQPPPGYGYAPGPHPNAYPNAGHADPYGPGPAGYPSPQPAPQWNYGRPVPNPNVYTPWIDRVLASVIDQLPIFVILFFGFSFLGVGMAGVASTENSRGEPSGTAIALLLLAIFAGFAVTLAYAVWNFGYRQGTTGQSIGKKAMKFTVISEKTGRPIGFGMSLLRQIAHVVDSIAYIGYLMPLWDGKRQTIADKIMTTVCVPAPVAPPVPGPPGGPHPYAYPPR